MKLYRILSGVILLIVLCLPTKSGLYAQNGEIFVIVSDDTLFGVDPDNPSQTTEILTVTPDEDEFLSAVSLSPDGQWVLLSGINMQSERFWRLINVTTEETVDIMQDIRTPDFPTLSADHQDFSWSPDSRYFAINYAIYGVENSYGVYLYDHASRQLQNLTPAGTNQYRVAWSDDSRYIATTSYVCDLSRCSSETLDIYDVPTADAVNSIDLSAFSAGPAGQATTICEVHWSPDNRFITFVDHCDGSWLGAMREVNLIDLTDETITQVTSITPNAIAPSESLFVAQFDTAWLNNGQLLIGAEIQEGIIGGNTTVLSTQTWIYDIALQSLTQVSEQRFGNWSITQDNLFAYLAYTYPPNPTYGTLPESAQVEIASYTDNTLMKMLSAPMGCDMQWNANGTILAYRDASIFTVSTCNSPIETLYFVNVDTGAITTYSPTETQVYPLGWIDVSQ